MLYMTKVTVVLLFQIVDYRQLLGIEVGGWSSVMGQVACLPDVNM